MMHSSILYSEYVCELANLSGRPFLIAGSW